MLMIHQMFFCAGLVYTRHATQPKLQNIQGYPLSEVHDLRLTFARSVFIHSMLKRLAKFLNAKKTFNSFADDVRPKKRETWWEIFEGRSKQ